MTKRPLTRRHRDGLLAVARGHRDGITDAKLRDAIGSYATNVIHSLMERMLITRYFVEAERKKRSSVRAEWRWQLTPRGHDVFQELADAVRR